MISNNFFPIDENIKTKIYNEYSLTPVDVNRDVQIIKEWIKQEPHLPQTMEDNLIEIWLIRSKFHLEKTKEKIDRYYSLKAVSVPIISKVSSELSDSVQQLMMILPLPTLTDKLERIIIFKARNNVVPSEEDILKFFKYTLFMNEYSLRCDYCLTYRLVQDFEGFTKEHVNRIMKTLTHIARSYKDAYFIRVASIEYLNVNPVVELVLKTLKASPIKIFPDKVLNRINIHRNFESLHKNINKAYLPSEYGGTLQTPLIELHDRWNAELCNNIDFLEKAAINDVADESKRIGEVKRDDGFGSSGTFKSLVID